MSYNHFRVVYIEFGVKMRKLASRHAASKSKVSVANDRIIDLVYLSKMSIGDANLEIEMLNSFSNTAKSTFLRLCLCIDKNEIKSDLDSLFKVARGVGAKTIMSSIIDAKDDFAKNGVFSSETIADIGFSVEEAREYIANISQ